MLSITLKLALTDLLNVSRRKLRSVLRMGDTRYHHTLWAKMEQIERKGRNGYLFVDYRVFMWLVG
jgi:hypothetical protein